MARGGQKDDTLGKQSLLKIIEAVRLMASPSAPIDLGKGGFMSSAAKAESLLNEAEVLANRIDARRGIKAESVEG